MFFLPKMDPRKSKSSHNLSTFNVSDTCGNNVAETPMSGVSKTVVPDSGTMPCLHMMVMALDWWLCLL